MTFGDFSTKISQPINQLYTRFNYKYDWPTVHWLCTSYMIIFLINNILEKIFAILQIYMTFMKWILNPLQMTHNSGPPEHHIAQN